jgi:hypothetical protein
VDGGGELRERCLVWSWTNNHVAYIDRPPKPFLDELASCEKKWGSEVFYMDDARQGFDVIITTPIQGTAWKYAFQPPPPTDHTDFMAVMPLILQKNENGLTQFDQVLALMNPAKTMELIKQDLGLEPRKGAEHPLMDESVTPFDGADDDALGGAL